MDLVTQIKAIIAEGGPRDEGEFEHLCLAVAEEQGLLRQGEFGLEGVEPVPEKAFKLMTIANFPPSEAEAEFWTSGTTEERKGRHLIRDLELYRLSSTKGFEMFALYPPRPKAFLSLIPLAQERPHSSLSWMVSFVLEAFAEVLGPRVRVGDRLLLDEAWDFIRRCERDKIALMILGTTLDVVALLEGCKGEGVRLPPGSRLMHTGGMKTSKRSVTPQEVLALCRAFLGLPEEDVIEEYGMTELLSQAYASPRVIPGPRRFVTVPWMRTRVLKPGTLGDCQEGGRGLLCHYDLANVYTAVCILTGDLANKVGSGFYDISRLPSAGPRGCSNEAGH